MDTMPIGSDRLLEDARSRSPAPQILQAHCRDGSACADGIQLSEAITGSRYMSVRTRAWLKTKNPDFERR